MILSIIIPAFNVEKWISRCIESCIALKFEKMQYEIIIVNDGSTDNTLTIIEAYCSCNNNIKIINRPNGGLSEARNTGLAVANGDYIWFVDSDDWINPDSVPNLIRRCNEDCLDILCFGLQLVDEDYLITNYSIKDQTDGRIMTGQDFIRKIEMPPAVWVALYKRSFLVENDLKFLAGVFHEDQEFTPKAYVLAKRIAFNPDVIYNYFQRTGSIMRSENYTKKASDLLKIADSLFAFANSSNLNSGSLKWLYSKIYFAFGQSITYAVLADLSLDGYKLKPYYPMKQLDRCSLYNKIKYSLINISPKLYKFFYRLLKK